jgi:hypothetical protein
MPERGAEEATEDIVLAELAGPFIIRQYGQSVLAPAVHVHSSAADPMILPWYAPPPSAEWWLMAEDGGICEGATLESTAPPVMTGVTPALSPSPVLGMDDADLGASRADTMCERF